MHGVRPVVTFDSDPDRQWREGLLVEGSGPKVRSRRLEGAIIMANRPIRALPVAALLAAGLAAPAAASVINGTGGPDVLVGTAAADTINGYAGNDTLSGKAGADRLYGGRGSDRMYAGDDARRDLLYAGSGPDRVYARMFDKVYAGPGNDVIRYVGTRGYFNFLQVDCGPGYDIVYGGWQAKILLGCEDLRPHSDNPL